MPRQPIVLADRRGGASARFIVRSFTESRRLSARRSAKPQTMRHEIRHNLLHGRKPCVMSFDKTSYVGAPGHPYPRRHLLGAPAASFIGNLRQLSGNKYATVACNDAV